MSSARETAEKLVDSPALQPTVWGIGSRERYIDAIAAALAAEREACAKVADHISDKQEDDGDGWSLGFFQACSWIAAAIRNRE